MSGWRVLVTAGPTIEDLDPVRFISNRSSGKMGYAVAEAARQRGAEVFLVSGPTNLPEPAGVTMVHVRSADEMKEAVLKLFPDMHLVVKAAAVADYRPADRAIQKIKKTGAEARLTLVPTTDILERIGKEKKQQILVGFAAETENLLESARGKMVRKNLDFIVANDVSSGVFGSDTSSVHILSRSGEHSVIEQQPKSEVAGRLLDIVVESRKSI
jgi:phosphopantothenoylcysteine decarboxylase/phosphopantothenate--cysteine ligase